MSDIPEDPEDLADLGDNLVYIAGEEGIPVEVTPPAPTGVVLHFRSGESQKVELVYTGLDLNGIHTWEVTTRPRYGDVVRISIAVMPPGTQIHIGGPGGP